PATTSLGLAGYSSHHSISLQERICWWVFLAAKMVLLVVIVFLVTIDLANITSTPLQPHGLLVGYVLVFRWALNDQRRRCPRCLRLLVNPIRIGKASQVFLEWYGTELVCAKGHGLLHVPEMPASSYSAPRWLNFDASWSALFSDSRAVTP